MATDFLDEKRIEIGTRLDQLRPLIEEYQRLEAAAAALDGVSKKTPTVPNGSARRAPAPRRATSSRRSPGKASRRGRPKGSGTRGVEALALVKASPGVTIPELAEKMGIKQNYLYRVLPGLARDGLVAKDGRGWHPTAGA